MEMARICFFGAFSGYKIKQYKYNMGTAELRITDNHELPKSVARISDKEHLQTTSRTPFPYVYLMFITPCIILIILIVE